MNFNRRNRHRSVCLQFEKCEPRRMLSTTWDVGALNSGVASWNDARGLGFMMFSEEVATTRFVGNNINNAEHFVPVRFRNDSTWQFNNNRGWANFEPHETDVLVAHLNFSLNTAASLENVNTRIGGVQTGYDSGDIVVIAGKWNGWDRPENFTVKGTSFSTFTSGDDVLPAGFLNHGGRVPESATGTAYVIYSDEAILDRWPDSYPFQAEHFFAARMVEEQWQYGTDSGWFPFQPEASDLVVAELNLENDSVKLWKGISYQIAGVQGGFHDGDITVAGGQLAGKASRGQFEVFGSWMSRYDKNTTELAGTEINNIVSIPVSTGGTGYVMYSVDPVPDRFPTVGSGSSNNFVAVRHNGSEWQYSDGSIWISFQPENDDVLVANVDFDSGLAAGVKGTAIASHNIPLGYADGDIVISSHRWEELPGVRQLQVRGTFIQPWVNDSVGNLNRGIQVQPGFETNGYLLYSQQEVQTRFAWINAKASEHFVAVMHDRGTWFYNNRIEWIEFTPAASDRLVAKIDFQNQTIDGITHDNRTSYMVEGIMAGTRYSDLRFLPNTWNGKTIPGRYSISGSHMLNDPVMQGTAFESPLTDLGTGILGFTDRFRKLPNHAIYSASGEPLLSWRVTILPYLGYHDLYSQFDLVAPWDSPQNLAMLDKMPSIYLNPELTLRNKTVYQVINGDNTAFPLGPEPSVNEFFLRETILAVETDKSRAVEWTRPLDLMFSEADPLDGLGGGFGESFDVLLGDRFDHGRRPDYLDGASTFKLPASIDPAEFTKLVERFAEPAIFDSFAPFEPAGNVLRSLALATHSYHDAFKRLPAWSGFDQDTGQPLLSWRVYLLPFLGYEDLFQQFNTLEPWDGPNNLQLLDQMPRVFDSPGLANNLTNYFSIVGQDTAFPLDGSKVTLETILDGPGRTVMFAEGILGAEWTRPFDLVHNDPIPGSGWSYSIDHATHVAMAGGNTELIGQDVADDIVNLLVKRNDGQEIPFTEYTHHEGIRDNLRSSAIASHNYHDSRKRLPAFAIYETPQRENPLLSWRVAILPYLGYQHLYDRFHLDEPWDSPHNIELLPLMPKEFAHPRVATPGLTIFREVVGETAFNPDITTVFPSDGKKVTLESIHDGLSNTLMYVEANVDRAIEWTRPLGIEFDYSNPWNGLGDSHPTGFHVVYADGSTGFIPDSLSADSLRHRLLKNDGS